MIYVCGCGASYESRARSKFCPPCREEHRLKVRRDTKRLKTAARQALSAPTPVLVQPEQKPPLTRAITPRTCVCGTSFNGKGIARFCPTCREQRLLESNRASLKRSLEKKKRLAAAQPKVPRICECGAIVEATSRSPLCLSCRKRQERTKHRDLVRRSRERKKDVQLQAQSQTEHTNVSSSPSAG
jgi:hypothetical protein